MILATGAGLLAASPLLLGALIGIRFRLPGRVVALVMALGAGVLIASVAYDLVDEALTADTRTEVLLGSAAGALVFFTGDVLVSRRGAMTRKRSSGTGMAASSAAATALALGALLDGIPESAALGVTTLESGAPSIGFLVAVALSNLPEGLSSAAGMRASGHSARSILTLWSAICLASGIAAGIGYVALGSAPEAAVAAVMSFAAGAVLCMLASTMLPEAAREGGPAVGLAATAGFLLAVLMGG